MAKTKERDYLTARESSLIPTGEAVIDPITISIDADNVLDLKPYFNGSVVPVVLQVKSDGGFVEGQDAPDQTKNFVRDANTIWSIPISERDAWHFKRASGAGTVTLKIKVLTAK